VTYYNSLGRYDGGLIIFSRTPSGRRDKFDRSIFMQVEIFTMADAATESAGKLNMLGSFDTIFSKDLPVIFPAFTILSRIRIYKGEELDHKFSVSIEGPDGNQIIEPFHGDLKFTFQKSILFATSNILFNLQGIAFNQFGLYKVILKIDEIPEMSIPLLLQNLNQ
jgi:hypothetical protein